MNPEIARKFIHLTAILIPGISYFLPRLWLIILLGLATLIFIVVDILRLKLPWLKGIFIILFGSMLRKRELRSLTGGTYLFMASFISALIFYKPIYMAAISYLIVGDTFAAIVGQSIGRIKLFNRKTLEGTISFFISCMPIVFAIHYIPFQITVPVYILIIGAFVASISELLPSIINDNVVIPISSGVTMQLLYFLLK